MLLKEILYDRMCHTTYKHCWIEIVTNTFTASCRCVRILPSSVVSVHVLRRFLNSPYMYMSYEVSNHEVQYFLGNFFGTCIIVVFYYTISHYVRVVAKIDDEDTIKERENVRSHAVFFVDRLNT